MRRTASGADRLTGDAFGVAGLGMGLAYSPLALIVLREAAPENQGAATSSLSLTDSLGTALGTGLTGAMVAASVRATGDAVSGLAVGFVIAFGLMLSLYWIFRSSRRKPMARRFRRLQVGSAALALRCRV